ncbi:MAG TPA: tripartite tricarboxylate transporter substrate binding protein [Xanthobacteraceae bacterium]|jgi:tripartite-type tricarboxylate transporter receptor subunit TctC|nr:tripartite tricarboxylate transporter substrate binding protein [Xanthobacteraceae bacterium]
MTFSARKWGLLAGLWALVLGGLPALALDYPARPVTIVVPFAAGGGTDILGRLVAQQLEQRLGRPFVIENRPGAGGTTGAGFVARANPDGYTLLMAPSPTLAVAITIYKNLAYDPVADFVPLALIAQTPFVLIVNPALPVHSVAELIALAKDKPGQLSFGSAGPGTPHHLYAELFKSMTGIEMSHVPYRGSLPLLNDVVAGHIPLAFIDFGPSIGMLRAGKVRPLGISTMTRLALFPDIPPIAEAGVPGFDAASWQMIVAPAKTPRPIVDKLHRELMDVVALPEFKNQIIGGGMLPMDNPSVEGLQHFIKAEIVRWGAVVRRAGLEGTE